MPHATARIVRTIGEQTGLQLKKGEEKRFERIGLQIGTALLSNRKRMILLRPVRWLFSEFCAALASDAYPDCSISSFFEYIGTRYS